MILLLLGTFKKDFSRPIKALEKAVKDGFIQDLIIVQAGNTMYHSTQLEIRQFFDSDELDTLYTAAEIVITHAGVGSILRGLKMHKKVIAIARLYKYQEHVDDHQLDILEEFANQGYLVAWNEGDDITTLITKARNFIPTIFQQKQSELESFLMNYIDELN